MFTRFAIAPTLIAAVVAAARLTAVASPSHAAGLPVPTVEYSADRVMETQAGTFEGKVYAAKDKLVMKDGSAGGFMWFTKDGILMKTDTVMKSGRDKSRMTVTLKNLKMQPSIDQARKQAAAARKAMQEQQAAARANNKKSAAELEKELGL